MVLYNWFLTPPGSTIALLLLAVTVALITAGLTKLLVDTKEVERKQRQIKEHQEEKAKIVKLAEIDPERYRKARKRWEKKDEMLKKTQQKIAMQRMKPACINCIPMMVLFIVIRSIIGESAMAISPMNASDVAILQMAFVKADSGPMLNFTGWYFICSLSMNPLIQRLLKIQTQTSGGGMGQMFSQSKSKSVQFPEI